MAVGIRYWDKESWISYLKSSVLPLYESILAVLNLWGRLKEVAHGKLLPEIIKDMPSLELVFADTSCRAFPVYRWLLGAYIGLRKYHFLKSLGKEPRITCRMQKTEVVKYLERISVLLERVLARACELRLVTQTELQSIQEVSKRVAQEILAKPESISERFTELLSKALKITVAYNEYTRFIWHLRKISKKYIAELYPELLKPDVFKLIKEVLGLREYIVPQVEDPEIVDMYTIFSFDYATRIDEGFFGDDLLESTYEYETIGGCMCRVNELIWALFGNRDLKLIVSGEMPDPFEKWRSIAVSELPAHASLKHLNSYEDLSLLDENLYAVFMGRAELVKGRDGRLLIIGRW